MLPLSLGFIPVILEIIGALFAGTVGANLILNPVLKPAALKAQPSVGIILADRPSGVVSGAAVVVNPGLVVTAYHVVDGATQIKLKFPKSEWLEPTVVSADPVSDVAILGISDRTVPALPLGDASSAKPQDLVLVVSFPSVAELSKMSPDKQAQAVTFTEATVADYRQGVLLFTPKTRLGGDGGPVVAVNGEILGIVREQLPAKDAATSSAIPANAVKPVLADALRHLAAAQAARPQPTPPAPPAPAATPAPVTPATVPAAPVPAQPQTPPTAIVPPAPAQPQTPPPTATVPPAPAQPQTPPPTATVPPAPAQPQTPPTATVPPAPAQPQTPPPTAIAPPAQAQPQTPPPTAIAPPAPTQPKSPAAPPAVPVAPTQPQVPVTPAAPPRPTPPAQPTPVPSDQFLVLPGKAIGSVTLGMRVQDLPAALGQPANRVQNPDGTTELYWYGPPLNRGIGVLVTKTGMVVRAWVLNDSRFITLHNLHIGSTEAEVRAALGTPTSTSVNAKQGVKALLYNQIGMWFFIQLNQNYNFYNQVFEIGILGR